MRHPLLKSFEKAEDEDLLKQMRFHAQVGQSPDPKYTRLLRLAAIRIEELNHHLSKLEEKNDPTKLENVGSLIKCGTHTKSG